MSLVIGSNNMALDPLRRQDAVPGEVNQNGDAAEVRINIRVDPPLPLNRSTAILTSSASAAVARDIGNAVLRPGIAVPDPAPLYVDAAGKGVSVPGGQTAAPARNVDQSEAVDRPPVLGPQSRRNCCQSEGLRIAVRCTGALIAFGGAVVTILAIARPDLQAGVSNEEQALGGAFTMVVGMLACLRD